MNLKKPPTHSGWISAPKWAFQNSRSVWVPADGVTSPSALPQWTWKGFQTRALLETWSLVSSTNFMHLSHLPKWQSSMSSGFPALSTFTTYHPSLPTFLQCSFLWWTNPYLLHIVCWPWLNMVLSLGRHLLCSLWRGGCAFSHILLRGGSPQMFPDKIYLVPQIKNPCFLCCSRIGSCAFSPLPAVILTVQPLSLILWFLGQLGLSSAHQFLPLSLPFG